VISRDKMHGGTPPIANAMKQMMIILNFHGVGPLPQREIHPGELECWLDEGQFEAILDLVRNNAQVRLTFDDGNASDHMIVLPALIKRKLVAEFFICSSLIGRPHFLNPHQIRELSRAGMHIGNHGMSHRSWRTLANGELHQELDAGRNALRLLTGKTIDSAACPFGAYDQRVLNALANAGYSTVFTSDGGPCLDGWLKARNTIRKSTTIGQVDRMIRSVNNPAWLLQCKVRTMMKCLRPGRIT
jgi:peptidoglycan/xylan/chitin deacetylase (PgdA/CDA1 family)